MNNKVLNGVYISIASPNQILKWTSRYINNKLYIGEVLIPDTINYKTGFPITFGLFCEKIFGPILNWECKCKKNFFNKQILCNICKVCGYEVNTNLIRRYRLGCIILSIPIFHPWFYKTNFSPIPLLLNISKSDLFNFIYYRFLFNKKKVLQFNKFNLNQLLNFNLYSKIYLQNLNILKYLHTIRENLLLNTSLNNKIFLKKFYYLNLFYINKLELFWLLMDILPILPPDLRPIRKLTETTFIVSPINNLYKNIIIYNNRLKKFKNTKKSTNLYFELLEKVNLQQSIESIFDNNSINYSSTSLTQSLLGKYGRFRQDLLGKRIDFSSRSVIVSGSDIPFNKVGIPISLAYNLFKPILKNILYKNKTLCLAFNLTTIKYTSILIKRILTRLFKSQIVLVNRAPTLHRMNIQAFKPYLIEGFAIKLFPLACTSFNADFDGDQMSILLTLTKATRLESKYIMASDKNIISSATGDLIYKINQGMVLGLYNLLYLNTIKNSLYYFNNINNIIDMFEQNLLNIKDKIWLKQKLVIKNNIHIYYFLTLVGRIVLFNKLNLTKLV